ncbi:hypothetical protein KCU91_g7909, partial [Aureobasidium melanogenum]
MLEQDLLWKVTLEYIPERSVWQAARSVTEAKAVAPELAALEQELEEAENELAEAKEELVSTKSRLDATDCTIAVNACGGMGERETQIYEAEVKNSFPNGFIVGVDA